MPPTLQSAIVSMNQRQIVHIAIGFVIKLVRRTCCILFVLTSNYITIFSSTLLHYEGRLWASVSFRLSFCLNLQPYTCNSYFECFYWNASYLHTSNMQFSHETICYMKYNVSVMGHFCGYLCGLLGYSWNACSC